MHPASGGKYVKVEAESSCALPSLAIQNCIHKVKKLPNTCLEAIECPLSIRASTFDGQTVQIRLSGAEHSKAPSLRLDAVLAT